MTKTSVKFRKNRQKKNGVAHTRYMYLLLYGEGRTEGRTEGRNAEFYVPLLLFDKTGDKKIRSFKSKENIHKEGRR